MCVNLVKFHTYTILNGSNSILGIRESEISLKILLIAASKNIINFAFHIFSTTFSSFRNFNVFLVRI